MQLISHELSGVLCDAAFCYIVIYLNLSYLINSTNRCSAVYFLMQQWQNYANMNTQQLKESPFQFSYVSVVIQNKQFILSVVT